MGLLYMPSPRSTPNTIGSSGRCNRCPSKQRSSSNNHHSSSSSSPSSILPINNYSPLYMIKSLIAIKRSFWTDTDNIRGYIGWLSNQLGITDVEDWKDVSIDELRFYSAVPLVRTHGGWKPFVEKYILSGR